MNKEHGFRVTGVNMRGQQIEFHNPDTDLYALIERAARGWTLTVGGALAYCQDGNEIRASMDNVIPDASGTYTSVFGALRALLDVAHAQGDENDES